MTKKLIEQLRWWASECDRTNFGCQARKLLLEAADALEETEPKRGRWERLHYVEGWARCSNCESPWELSKIDAFNMDFCPNCGADMRTKEGEDV